MQSEQYNKILLIFRKLSDLDGIWDILPKLYDRLDRLRQAHEMSVGMNNSI